MNRKDVYGDIGVNRIEACRVPFISLMKLFIKDATVI